MSFPRYPKYKDSGVEWLGAVPEHWMHLRYKNVFREKDSVLGHSLPPGAISFGKVVLKDGDAMNEATRATYQEVLTGEFLINPINLNYDLKSLRTALSEIDTCVSPAYIVLKLFTQANSQYLKYQLFLFDIRHMKTLGAGVRQTISFADIGPCFTILPPLEEQTSIAAFLDRETAKIDALVAEQQRLMELLKEKRQAVISHAVTRGLNPAAPLKDSGIEWLGNVPAMWEVPLLGLLISNAELGGNHDSSEGNEGMPVMKMGNLDRGFIKLDKVEYLPMETEISEAILLKNGDVLFNTRNSLDLVGKVAIWRGELSRATYNSNILRISFNPLKVTSPEFINYFFNSDLGISQLRALAKGTTSVAAIYYKDLTSLRVILPPAAEQHSITKYLDDACAKLDALTSESQHAIDLLQERRTSLISAAVTGQIKVS